ncbi:hypothetical protein AVEN_169143-1 [Araneus ventricosus]|uniref:Uncharacterized protein n=1 Tax=Araneus ventricosus TaxID=182803 RepID=A0A4Y2PWX0_ARAVE|nr:hypothetical protein AVEN_169143-1 [Araneus ventricosus]
MIPATCVRRAKGFDSPPDPFSFLSPSNENPCGGVSERFNNGGIERKPAWPQPQTITKFRRGPEENSYLSRSWGPPRRHRGPTIHKKGPRSSGWESSYLSSVG